MTNLKQTAKDKWRFVSGDSGDAIEIVVHYSKGMNANRRGVVVGLTPVTFKDGFMSFSLLSGYTVFVEKLARQDNKAVAKWAEIVDPMVTDMMARYQQELVNLAEVPAHVRPYRAGEKAAEAFKKALEMKREEIARAEVSK